MKNILASSSKIRKRSPGCSIPTSPQNGSFPKLSTKEEQGKNRILVIMGILVVTAVITGVFMITGMGWVLSSVRADRDRLHEQETKLVRAAMEIGQLMRKVRGEIAAQLDEGSSATQAPIHLQPLRETIQIHIDFKH